MTVKTYLEKFETKRGMWADVEIPEVFRKALLLSGGDSLNYMTVPWMKNLKRRGRILVCKFCEVVIRVGDLVVSHGRGGRIRQLYHVDCWRKVWGIDGL